MNKTQQLCDLGQSLWLDNITRKMLDDGSLRRTIEEFSITGLTSNPTIFDGAIGNSGAYDEGIREKAAQGRGIERRLKGLDPQIGSVVRQPLGQSSKR